ncbi:hypothetical protein LLG90_25555 [Aromatoleum toluclasticum]|uniref:hypothetical protein n=1 Tax=Aromatoleum toluclasticum TaxID=92003 RepID=UPI001D1830A4|nr:hypothetical protein [Aromatoleum toluclasticum]MCC4118729.1 hypothetical protein [Aromatoleum toluclasticum]
MESTEKKLLAEGISSLYKHRDDFIVFGLTGRTGSGCSTAADQLVKSADKLVLGQPASPLKTNDERKYSIVWDWTKKHWHPFSRIRVSDLIISKALSTPLDDLKRFLLGNNTSEAVVSSVVAIIESIDGLSDYSRFWQATNIEELEQEEIHRINDKFFNGFDALRKRFRDCFEIESNTSYTTIMQLAGDNLRRSGSVISNECIPEQLFSLPSAINRLIKIFRKSNRNSGAKSYFVIDAIRHPFEAIFLRERYSSFYLIGVTTDELSRKKRLNARYNDEEIKLISEKEYPTDDLLKSYSFLVTQNIGACLQQADILINNKESALENDFSELTENLAKYVALAQHPGLVPPTPIERCMQIAMTAKLNSGCISRQVGAAISGNDYSITAIGWNSVPQGQVPCSLRNIQRLKNGTDKDSFSSYEQKEFRKEISKLHEWKCDEYSFNGRPLSYCFKSSYNKAKKPKTQVQPRSLHAEENAFLQIVKNGGIGIKNGFLFTTASPCELCSKKAYQLGIKKIYYIEPYPGIANDHILDCGSEKPELILFTGAIGRAYIHLYHPLLSQKDELEILLSASASQI